MQIPTVKIVNPVNGDGFTVINEEDFDKKKHKLFEEKAPEGDQGKGDNDKK